MLDNVIVAVRNTIVTWARAAERAVKRLLRPAVVVTTAAAGVAGDATRSRRELVAENAFLRLQLIVLRRSVKRPILGRAHRLFLVVLARCTRAWRDALHLVQPQTLLRWHRDLFKVFWRRKSRPKGQPKRLPQQTIDLIKHMAVSNVTWGAERMRGELLKLGIRVSKRTIQKYIRPVRPPGNSGHLLKNSAFDLFESLHAGDRRRS